MSVLPECLSLILTTEPAFPALLFIFYNRVCIWVCVCARACVYFSVYMHLSAGI